MKGLFCGVGWAWLVSPELRASFPTMLCHGTRGPERRRAYLGSSPAPAPRLAGSSRGGVDARTARAFITADAVALAEAAEVLGADFQAERFEMRPHFAGVVGFAGVPHHVNQRVQLPPIRVAEGRAQAAFL